MGREGSPGKDSEGRNDEEKTHRNFLSASAMGTSLMDA